MRLTFFHLCQICVTTFVDQWWDEMPFAAKDLDLTSGAVRGKVIDFWGDEIEIYRGVRYATAERFRHAVPVSPGNDSDSVFDATEKAPSCFQVFNNDQDEAENVQANFDEGKMTEDCLTVDIYRPKDSENAGILFWIHGGGFITGNSQQYDGIAQARRGNIVVAIQYRLGLFGFMNLFDTEAERSVGGNYGLMDQQLALQFVSQNAQNIGGDPDRITIIGESAGSFSVSFQLLNEVSAQYIYAAIGQSGSGLVGMIFEEGQNNPAVNQMWHNICRSIGSCDTLDEIDDHLNRPLQSAQDYVEMLRNAPAADIWTLAFAHAPGVPGMWSPMPDDGVFMVGDYRDKIRNGNVPTNIPYFITTTSYEGGALLQRQMFDAVYPYGGIDAILPGAGALIGEYLATYNEAAGVNVELSDLTSDQAYILGTFLYQDYVIRGPSFEEAAAYLAAGANVYTMFFDTDTTFDFLSPGVESCCGVAHAADLLYTFEVNIPGVTSESDIAVGQYIGAQFSSIINTGSPMDDWPLFSADGTNMLTIRNTPSDVEPSIEEWTMPSLTRNAIGHWAQLAGAVDDHHDSTAVGEAHGNWLIGIIVGVAVLIANVIPALIAIIVQFST